MCAALRSGRRLGSSPKAVFSGSLTPWGAQMGLEALHWAEGTVREAAGPGGAVAGAVGWRRGGTGDGQQGRVVTE